MIRLFNPKPSQTKSVIDEKDQLQHMRARRIGDGDKVILLNGRGDVYTYKMSDFGRDQATLEYLDHHFYPQENTKTLCIAICRFKALELIAQKACELGISTIQPVITQHVGTQINERVWQKKVERLSTIMQQSICQSGNPYLPHISPLKNLCDLRTESLCVADKDGESIRTEKSDILIGPEGGFSQEEYNYFKENDIAKIKFPGYILRAETAAIIAMSQLMTS